MRQGGSLPSPYFVGILRVALRMTVKALTIEGRCAAETSHLPGFQIEARGAREGNNMSLMSFAGPALQGNAQFRRAVKRRVGFRHDVRALGHETRVQDVRKR
jgi:hypothetical protein